MEVKVFGDELKTYKAVAVFAHVVGLVAVTLGILAINGVIPANAISDIEAALGVAIGGATVFIGRMALKRVAQLEGGE